MHGHHIAALVQERVGGSGLLGLVGPATGHDNHSLGLGIHRPGAHLEGVHIAQGVADGHADDEPELVGPGHLARAHAHGVPGDLGGTEEDAEVLLGVAVAGMLKGHVPVPLGHLPGEVLVPEAGGEDQFGALLDHAFHDPLGIGAFRHVLRLDDLDPRQLPGDLGQGIVEGLVVAVVVGAAHVDSTNDEAGGFGLSRGGGQTNSEDAEAGKDSERHLHRNTSRERDGLGESRGDNERDQSDP